MSEHRNLIDLQRAAAFRAMGMRAKELLEEGYGVDADRVLDEMIYRRATGRVLHERDAGEPQPDDFFGPVDRDDEIEDEAA